MRAHDVEEFSAIIKRHGLWKGDLEEFGKVIRQGDLFAGATTETNEDGGTVVTIGGQGRRARPQKPAPEAEAAARGNECRLRCGGCR